MILALDLATRTGFAAGAGDCLPELGAVQMPSTGEEVGPFLDFFEKWLNLQIDTFEPTLIMMEAPYIPRAKINEEGKLETGAINMAVSRKLQGLAGLTEMVAYRHEIPVRESQQATVKKTLTGSGRAEKSDMVRVAKRLGYNQDIGFDEADALGVWFEGVRYYAKPFWPMWSERLLGAK